MRTLTAILNNLTDFTISAAAAQTRLEALQPSSATRNALDLDPFLRAQ